MRRIREQSLSLQSTDGLVVQSPYQAYLLHPTIRKSISAYWRANGSRFRDLPISPTYNLRGGFPVSRVRQDLQLASLGVKALIR